MSRQAKLERRLKVFLDAGMLEKIPSRWQLLRASLEMAPYVVSTEATDDEGYRGAPLGHPVVRQPLIASQVGLDHFAVGSGLGVALESQCTHLHLTFHRGLPVFDLQIVQTHDDGLAHLRRRTEELLAGNTPRARRTKRLASLILADADSYHRQFLGEGGWIAQAESLQYPSAAAESSPFPAEFFGLVDLLRYACGLPNSPPGPRAALSHLNRRQRSGGQMGWFKRAA